MEPRLPPTIGAYLSSVEKRYARSVHYFIPRGGLSSTNTPYSPGGLFLSSLGDSDSSLRQIRLQPATRAPDAGKTGIHLTTPEQCPALWPKGGPPLAERPCGLTVGLFAWYSLFAYVTVVILLWEWAVLRPPRPRWLNPCLRLQ